MTVLEGVYRQARIRTTERGTSVSAMVAACLRSLAGPSPEFIRMRELERTITEGIRDFSAADRMERDELHERGAGAIR